LEREEQKYGFPVGAVTEACY